MRPDDILLNITGDGVTFARALYREWFVHFRFPDFAKASSGRPGHEKIPRVASPRPGIV